MYLLLSHGDSYFSNGLKPLTPQKNVYGTHEVRPFARGPTTLLRGLTNHWLLTTYPSPGMILQVGIGQLLAPGSSPCRPNAAQASKGAGAVEITVGSMGFGSTF